MKTSARRLGVLLAAVAILMAACSGAEESGGEDTAAGSNDTASTASDGAGDEGEAIKIGVILELTGEGASLGAPMRAAIELAAAEINEAGGIEGSPVELVVEDNQSKEDVSARLLTQMLSEQDLSIMLGPSRSGNALAMRPIAEREQVPMISLSANSQVTQDAKWVFKTVQNDNVILQNMVNHAAEQGWETLGLLRDGSGFGEGVDTLLTELAAEQNIEVVAVEKFEPTATDFTAQMVNLRSTGADANVIWGIPPAVALAQKAYVDLKVDAPLMQSHGIGNAVFLETAGEAANGVIAPLGRLLVADQLPEDDPQKEVIDTFSAKYEEVEGSAPSTFAGNAYDAMQIASATLREAGTEPEAIRSYIESLEGLVGVTGVYNFSQDNHSGLGVDAPAIVTVEDGEWILVDNNRG